MSKNTYRVQHAGQEFTRVTARTYSHVVLVKVCRDVDLRNLLAVEAERKEKEGWARDVIAKREKAGEYERFGVHGWCGRADLATKLADKAKKSEWYTEVLIVEVLQN